jgi:hypothetical protein
LPKGSGKGESKRKRNKRTLGISQAREALGAVGGRKEAKKGARGV